MKKILVLALSFVFLFACRTAQDDGRNPSNNSSGGNPTLKDIQIDKIILGYPNISERDGKTVEGKELNENATIPDFEVPDSKFPIMVLHKKEFTVEHVFITFDGTKEELSSPVSKTMLTKDYSLVENKKTQVIIEIKTIEVTGYKPIKLTFNVTYKKATKKYVDDITNIMIIRNKSGKLVDTYGGVGTPIAKLKDGQTTIDVSRPDPIMAIIVNKGSGGQPKAEVKLDGDVMAGKDFAMGQNTLEVQFNTLSTGKHRIEVKLEKPGYETANYDFYIHYRPLLTFKSLTINGKVYNTLDQIKQIKLEVSDPNPVTISGEVNEVGATVYFKKIENKKLVDITSSLDLKEGENLSLRMYASLDGYTTTFFAFRLARKKNPEKIVITKIEVDGKEVAKGGLIEVEKEEAKVKLVLTLKQKYEDISFTINDNSIMADLGIYGMIATFDDFAITKDGELQMKIKASAPPDYIDCEETITIKHKSPAQQQSGSYIVEPKVGYFDSDDGWTDYDLKPEGSNWKGSCDESATHRFVVKIQTKDKDLSDISKFKLSIVDKSNGDKVYLDKATTSIVDKVKKNLTWQKDRGTDGKEIRLSKGEHDFEVKIYFEEQEIENTHFMIKIGD